MLAASDDSDLDVPKTAGTGGLILARLERPSLSRGLWQLASTMLPYAGLVWAMYATVSTSVWLTLLLAVPAAGLLLRIFSIQHDCGHGSFVPSRQGNRGVGLLCSLLTLTPFDSWRRQHAQHHAVWNNLDGRDRGLDIYSTCLTVREYRALSPAGRLRHRMLYHPLVAILLLPPVVFLVLYRFPFDMGSSWRRERRSVLITNAMLLVFVVGLVELEGARAVALVQLPCVVLASILGGCLFSVQHRFEHAVWAPAAGWKSSEAALASCSFLRLPRVLQWLTGNTGFHHVHHLHPRIPNYALETAQEVLPRVAAESRVVTLGQVIGALRYTLWDEDLGKMVRF
jgi:omega-6 fatty acid desaturase (delta-12 desaturase)